MKDNFKVFKPAGKMQFEFRANLGTYNRGISEYSTMNANQFMEASWMDLRNSRITAGDDAATAAAYATNNLISERLYLNIYNRRITSRTE